MTTEGISADHRTAPQVSIIMAAKDEESYIESCLDSILQQTYTNWELIVVNDHSVDRTPEILKSYAAKDNRIKVFDSDRPLLIPTLQKAYAKSKGELINRMDADDRMPDYKLKVLVEEWKKHGIGTIIAGGTQHFVDKGTVGEGFRKYDQWLNYVARNNLHYEEIYKECVIPSHCWIIHRSDFDRVGAFDPEIYPEDYDLCFRFYKHKLKVVGIPQILHYWRDHSIRISRTWDCYKDNRYFDLKIKNFYDLDRDINRPLAIWGAGSNGKDLVKLVLQHENDIIWVCDNYKKIGKSIYGVNMNHFEYITQLNKPQILVAVASPNDRKQIRTHFEEWGKNPVVDFWFFS